MIEIRPMEPGINSAEPRRCQGRLQTRHANRGCRQAWWALRRGLADLAKVIRGEKEFEWSYDHDLAVQETASRVGMPLE